jgi:hypothetical protein
MLAALGTAGAAPSLEAQLETDGRLTLIVSGGAPGCTIGLHGHPKRRRAATGALLASAPAPA